MEQAQTGFIQEEMNRISAKGLSLNSSYMHSFGALADGTRYMDARMGVDLRPQLKAICDEGRQRVELKALTPTTGGAGTAGYAMVPIYVDPRVVDQSRKFTPLVEMIPRVTNQGLTADYNIITAKGGAYTANADAALPETDDTYDRVSKSIKFLYAVGRVLGPSQAAYPSYMLEGFQPNGTGTTASNFSPAGAPNAKQLEVLMKARALKELEENLIVNGSATTDATQFDGIIVLQSTTNKVDLNTTALTWDDVETAIQYAFDDGGRPKLAIASSSVVVDLRKLMQDQFRYTPDQMTNGELPYGIPAQLVIQTMVGPIPVIPSMFLSNTTGSKAIYFIDTDFVEMRVLQDMTYEDLAKTNDSQKFMLKIYECLIMRSTGFNSWIGEIA